QRAVRRVLLPLSPERRPLSLHAAPLEGGGLGVQFRDATEEVRQSEQHLALLEAMKDGFVVVDDEGRIAYLNAAGETLLRIRREAAVGMSVWNLLPPDAGVIRDCIRSTMAARARQHLRRVEQQ